MTHRPDRILVVEDDTNIRHILRIQLEGAGYEVICAEDGLVALDLLEREMPDLVLLDVMMPRMDGFAVCRAIRADRRIAHLPVIFLTAKSESQSRVEGLTEGANDYITKPYTQEELLARVQNFITWSRAQRHSNPLTGLPGNPSIEAEVERRIGSGRDFAFLYLDLDHFKAYNDYYSYMAGDRVIQLLARILQETVSQGAGPEDFVGHVGGDDFVALTTVDRARALAEEVAARFDREILEHYSTSDRERGFVEIANRRGELERFPVVSVTIALVQTTRHPVHHVAELNDLVADLKKAGKQRTGSVVVEDRRWAQDPISRTGSDG